MSLFLLVRAALGAGYSLDIELLRPSPTPDHTFGVDGPAVVEPHELRMITYAQVQKDPLVVYEFGKEADSVIGTRNAWHLGASYGLYKHVALRTVLPLAVQWGGESDELGAGAGGLGDWSAGLTWQVIERPFGSLGGRTDFYAPTSAAQSYMGEQNARFDAGLLASLDVGPVRALVDTTLMSRELVATDQDLDLGSELTTTAALRCAVHPRADLGLSALTRTGIGHFLQDAETPMELVGGVQLHPSDRLQVDVGGGRGVLQGYGTTKLRAVLGLTFRAPPPVRSEIVPEAFRVSGPYPPPPPPPVFEEPDPDALVVLWSDVIEPRDPIRFEVDTANVLPESLPFVDATAQLLIDHPELSLVAIEGHASEEGTYEHNYALSTARALAIYQALIQRGIHPDRLALRPWGEPKPLATGAAEDDLRANRAVVFLIERRLLPFEQARDYGPAFTSPVDGQTIPIAAPTEPPPPPPPAIDPSMFDPEE
jgi:outer membrane protein OmpA-like peptidoglycan-associated protein